MAGAKEQKARPYGFTPIFERMVVALLSTKPRFCGRIGQALDADAMPTATGRLVVESVQAIIKDTGQGPTSALVMIQRLRRWVDEGKVTIEEVDAVDDMIAEAEDEGLPTEDEVVAELAPMLKRRLESEAIKVGMSDFSNRRPLERTRAMLEQAESLGKQDSSLGVKVGGVGSFAVIDQMRNLERLPTGVAELDSELGGGPARGTLMMFIGASNDGKSMALSHMSANASRCGLFVGYATLELPEAYVLARIKANHTDVPIDAVLEGDEDCKIRLAENPPPGPCYVKEFTPQVTTVADIKGWVRACEDLEGRHMDLLVVDYADKMTAHVKGARGEATGAYKIMEYVYEGLRLFVNEERMWGATASQATRDKKRKNKLLDGDDVSDSINKIRVVDLAITLNLDDEEMTFYVAKNRMGRSRFSVGPLPTDFSIGAVAPITPMSGEPGEFLLAHETEQALTGTALDDI